jgi:hypothetical protein
VTYLDVLYRAFIEEHDMFDRRSQAESSEITQGGREHEKLASEAAVLFTDCIKLLVSKAMEEILDQMTAGIAALHTAHAAITRSQQAILNKFDDRLAAVNSRLATIETGQQQIIYSLQHVEEQLEGLIAESKLLENASQEMRLLSKEHYQDHVIEPMARSLFGLFDFVEKARGTTARCSGNGEIQEFIEAVSVQLRQFLSSYQIEPILHKPGAKFDPGEMRPVKTVCTHDRRLADRVERSLQAGFRCGRERLLRAESIALYKYREPKSISRTKERT